MATTRLGGGGSGRLLDSQFQPGEEDVHLLFHQARSLATEQIVLSMRGSLAKARHLRDIVEILPVQHISTAELLRIGIDTWPCGDGETEFLDRGPKGDFQSRPANTIGAAGTTVVSEYRAWNCSSRSVEEAELTLKDSTSRDSN